MVNRKTQKRTKRSAKTRRVGKKGSVLNVVSESSLRSFENTLSRGPLTLVYINAKWCGACHQFSENVWSPLTQLKNKTMNMAAVDSEMIGKTSLANVPREFYPTLLLVGKDKKPAIFKDENNLPTNAMPRKENLSEDKEFLTNLVKSNVHNTVTSEAPTLNSLSSRLNRRNSPPRAIVTPESLNNLGKSPYDTSNSEPSIMSDLENETKEELPARTVTVVNTLGIPPDVGADLVASQKKASTPKLVVGGSKSGKLLTAIREHASSLKSILNLRAYSTRKSRR